MRVFDEALKSPMVSSKHGVVIYNNRGIISTGHNYYLSNNQTHDRKRSICAETAALQKCRKSELKRIKGSKMLLLKLNKSNRVIDQVPCDKCAPLIAKLGLVLIRITPDLPRIKINILPALIWLESEINDDADAKLK